jgi:hypothetical protein
VVVAVSKALQRLKFPSEKIVAGSSIGGPLRGSGRLDTDLAASLLLDALVGFPLYCVGCRSVLPSNFREPPPTRRFDGNTDGDFNDTDGDFNDGSVTPTDLWRMA